MTPSRLQITVQGTPNPNAAKFLLDRDVPGTGSRSYLDSRAASAVDDPLAARIFAVRGVRAVLIVENFITVTKYADVSWPEIVPAVDDAIRAGLADAANL